MADTDNKIPTSLKTLAENKVPGISKSTTFRVDPDLISFESGFNLRVETDELELHIDRLFEALKAGAFIPPVDVSIVEGKVICRDGHCRTKAAQRLKKELPDYTLEARQLRGNESDAVLHMLGTGSGGKPLSPLEQGIGYLRLTKMGLTPVQIAAKLGVSRVTVDNGLILAEAPVDVQQMIANGEVSGTLAREAIKGGKESMDELKSAVKAEREKPTKKKGKKGKKGNKVTAKTLGKGKKASAAKKAAGTQTATTQAQAGPTQSPPQSILPASKTPPPDGWINIALKTETATATLEFIKAFGGDDEALKPVIVALETALL